MYTLTNIQVFYFYFFHLSKFLPFISSTTLGTQILQIIVVVVVVVVVVKHPLSFFTSISYFFHRKKVENLFSQIIIRTQIRCLKFVYID